MITVLVISSIVVGSTTISWYCLKLYLDNQPRYSRIRPLLEHELDEFPVAKILKVPDHDIDTGTVYYSVLDKSTTLDTETSF